jgi:hypothetical protein
MGGPGARRSVEQGADTPVWLATLPDADRLAASSATVSPFPGEFQAARLAAAGSPPKERASSATADGMSR